jgi:hypothetical protein
MLIVGLSGLVLLFVDTLPLNLMTYALMALGSVSMLLVSSYHWYKGYAPARLFAWPWWCSTSAAWSCCRPCWA